MFLPDSVAALVRRIPIRGKTRLFLRMVPPTGQRLITLPGGASMEIDLSNGHQRMMYVGSFLRPLVKIMRGLLNPGDRVVDIGANVGFVSLAAAGLVGATGKVFAVEPFPSNLQSLRRNLELNPSLPVRVEAVAVAETRGKLCLYAPPEDEHRDFNVSLIPVDGYRQLDVPATPLDELWESWGCQTAQLLKIDVEGAEPIALRGGAKVLSSGKVKHVFTEVNGYYLPKVGSSPQKLIDQFIEFGFLPARLEGNRAVPFQEPEPAPDGLVDDRLFVHRTAL